MTRTTMAAVLLRGRPVAISTSSENALPKIIRRYSSNWAPSLSSRSSALQHGFSFTPPITTTAIRHISSTSYMLHKTDEGQLSTADLHSLYHEQMKEIQSEREAIFGTSSDEASESADLSQAAKPYVTPPSSSEPSPMPQFRPDEVEQALEQAQEEREAIFAFSEEEKSSWTNNNSGTSQIKSSHMHRIREVMREVPHTDDKSIGDNTQQQPASTMPFTHLNPQGDGVSMVDVGHKTSSRRVALARSVVVFPPEVMSAFQLNSTNSEMIGPKGPIFETAKIAGIMGAKKTSDLIPLCHPLPLDRVNINIQLINNQAIIECECRVTHKTGVEMEALTGATVAALTIYDMVKAVSHRVEIGQTVLVSKSGGKSDFVHN